jgi:DNA-binding NtrC family response regulator
VDDTSVSRQHALLQRQADGAYLLIDLGSTNGTLLNDRPLCAPTVLRDGDVIRIGPLRLTFRRPAAAPAAQERTAGLATERAGDQSKQVALLGRSAAMAHVFRLIERAAASPIPVLIQGETGTGKELVARAIHDGSSRAAGPFVALNCAALPESLLESELFGHRRGAFTGAHQDRKGLFETASGGTVFLDEIGELPMPAQAKLLRVLQECEVTLLGDSRPRRVDVRVVSATNRDLAGEVEGERFRSDLYYRLAAFTIRIPPLRERVDDILLIAKRVVVQSAERHRKRVRDIDAAAEEMLLGHSWPGNVRELQNELERAVALAEEGAVIGAELFSEALRAARAGDAGIRPVAATQPAAAAMSNAAEEPPGAGTVDSVACATATSGAPTQLKEARAAFEAEHIAKVLADNKGNVSRAARELGLSRTALYQKMKEYGLGG